MKIKEIKLGEYDEIISFGDNKANIKLVVILTSLNYKPFRK